jgi:hypothetical protein
VSRIKVPRQLRLLHAGLTALAILHKRDRNLRRLVAKFWFIATRQGLIGLRLWLIEATSPFPPANSPKTRIPSENTSAPPPDDYLFKPGEPAFHSTDIVTLEQLYHISRALGDNLCRPSS